MFAIATISNPQQCCINMLRIFNTNYNKFMPAGFGNNFIHRTCMKGKQVATGCARFWLHTYKNIISRMALTLALKINIAESNNVILMEVGVSKCD